MYTYEEKVEDVIKDVMDHYLKADTIGYARIIADRSDAIKELLCEGDGPELIKDLDLVELHMYVNGIVMGMLTVIMPNSPFNKRQ